MDPLLPSDEKQLGNYKIRFTRFVSGQWHTRGPWMRLIVTSDHLTVLPLGARHTDATPLTIPAENIARVWSIGLGRRDGGMIAMKSGTLLYFYVEWSQSARMMRDIARMLKSQQPAAAASVGN